MSNVLDTLQQLGEGFLCSWYLEGVFLNTQKCSYRFARVPKQRILAGETDFSRRNDHVSTQVVKQENDKANSMSSFKVKEIPPY